MGALSLARMAEAVEAELQQAPDVRAWRTRIRRVISDVYMELWSSRPWPFRIREAPLWVYPDFELTKSELFIANATGLRVFGTNGLATVLSDKMFPTAQATGGIFAEHIEHLVGAEVGIESPSTSDKSTGNWLEGPFVVEKILYPGAIYAHQIWLDPRCNVTAVDTGATGGLFQVRFPRYLLPYDCDQLVHDGIKDEYGMSLRFLDSERFRWLRQGAERPPRSGGGAIATAWTYDEGIDTTAPLHRAVGPNFWSVDAVAPQWVDHHTNVGIRETITGTVSAGAGTFTVGQRYRFAVSWYYAGRFGPLSNIVEATPTVGGTQRVTLANLPQIPAWSGQAPETTYGWSLAVWVATGDGPLYLSQHLNPAPSSGGVSTTLILQDPPASTQVHQKRLRQSIVSPTSHRYVRIHPRPTEHKKYQIRYLRRAVPLEGEEDVPEFAEQFHMAIVYAAAARLAALREGQSSRSSLLIRLTGLAEAKLAELAQFYFPGQHFSPRKGSILTPVVNRWLIDSIDYNGDS